MRFLIDSMFPPRICEYLIEEGHDALTPTDLGAHNLADEVLVELAAAEQRVVVTENYADFARVTVCSVLLVRKAWWPRQRLLHDLAGAIDRWAKANPVPGQWAQWLGDEYR